MHQQIDFYPLLTLEKPTHFGTKRLIYIYLAFCTFLVIATFWMLSTSIVKSKQRNRIDAELITVKKNLDQLLLQNPILDPQQLLTSIEQLNKQFEVNKKIFLLLSNQYTFSDVMKAIATQNVEEVWLNEINISETDATISLKGHALQSIYLEEFLNQLRSQPIFKTRNLYLEDLNNVVSEKDKIESLNFNLIIRLTDTQVAAL